MVSRVVVTVFLAAVVYEWVAIWFDWWPTYTELIERLPADAASLLVGSGMGALGWWVWSHFDGFRK